MNKILLPVFAALAVGAGIFGFSQMSAVDERNSELAKLKDKLAKAEEDRDAALKSKNTLTDELAELQKRNAALAKSAMTRRPGSRRWPPTTRKTRASPPLAHPDNGTICRKPRAKFAISSRVSPSGWMTPRCAKR
jgi:hypothetical protein